MQGLWEDPTILFVSDVEVVETRMMEGDPFLVAQFHCQQLKCTRDAYGNVVEGASDTIQRVYYFWGLQQVSGAASRQPASTCQLVRQASRQP